MFARIVCSLIAGILATASCATSGGLLTRRVQITTPYDGTEAKSLLKQGSNTVTGSALIRQKGGGVVTCAGNDANLIPATAYARERMHALYGSDSKGYRGGVTREVIFEPEEPEYKENIRTTRCDAQGFFKFRNVADGQFFVVTSVLWSSGYVAEGGVLMQRVSLSDGQEEEIVLSP